MAKRVKANIPVTDDLRRPETGLNRRAFFTQGVAAAGVGAAVLAGTVPATAEQDEGSGIEWDYEVDVVVVGAGATGLPAAIRARDLGATVLIVEQNFEVGGKMLHSTGLVSLGGGDQLQLRDIRGEADPDGYITVPPLEDPEELEDDVDLLFRDMTDWSVVDPAAQAPYRYNERPLHRAWADNCPAVRTFLLDNHVRMARISGTHGNAGMSRARRAYTFFVEGETTDVTKGTITIEDAGIPGVSSSLFAPTLMQDGSATVREGARTNGTALARPLEYSARQKGVKFLMNRHMDEIIREEQFSGRVLGIKATFSPRLDPVTGERLVGYWNDGNIDDEKEVVYIKARKAVVIGAGGHTANPEFRGMFHPGFREPAFVSSGWAFLGPRGQDASGIKAGMRVGAGLAGMQQNLSYPSTFHFPGTLATRDPYTTMLPGHPTFSLRGATGIDLGADSFQHLIAVNQVGKRFFNEMTMMQGWSNAAYPPGPRKGQPEEGLAFRQLDWRNASAENIRTTYSANAGVHAATAVNEGSQAPDFHSGPIWAIFDQGALDRDGWDINPPFTSPDNGLFFSADTIEELAWKIRAGCEWQRVELSHLVETVEIWNRYVDDDLDPEFERGPDAPMFRIDKPRFFAAALFPVWHDSYGGLHINGKAQVVDLEGQVIPGLYAGGESSGGGNQHGLGRAIVHGYIAATNAVQEPIVS
ncbi:FAD-dependent oxidoreductase [Devosia nitrariae]|uniref:FAD-binding dehydrogenase n=1 Tax=Devosia nitrariae TaxID=2071872 RepID=A0ABQ5W907_9HYPH|nr:FAD-dependent oxidoreductase [Devosia nitrariae]GLQ56116.1 FAD-binding dehydrogenase [Devosia nitrariae]